MFYRTRSNGLKEDHVQDNFKLQDSKGNFIFCYKCGKSSMGRREIIKCDFCTLYWHLDCLDPPLANPPLRNSNSDRPRYSWKCPAHADVEVYQTDAFGRPRKARKPKNVRVIDAGLRRGFTNNGIIEIENTISDDDDALDVDDSGAVYRLAEKGIVLDFIDRNKR